MEKVIYCTWESRHVVDVPEDFELPANLSDFPPDVLEQLTPLTAGLRDWR